VLQVLDAAAVRRWCAQGLAALQAAREEIDDLNVYPVPDGDTGTNLVLTMESVAEALGAAGADLEATTAALSRGALMGARGNSGVILSQLLRGICEVLSQGGTATHLQEALVRAAQLGYAAVASPVEGTVLTVAREAAAAAAEIGPSDLPSVVRAARAGAAAALASTPDLLPALKAAGVVDAGGRGLCVLLEALEAVVTGQAVQPVAQLLVPRDRSGLAHARESGSDDYAYEVQYLLDGTDPDRVARLTQELGGLGDSLVVVGGPDLWNVHVHVNDVGAAVEAGVEAGRPWRITVTRFADQVAADTGTPTAPSSAGPRRGRAVVAVAPGAGLAALFEEAGAVVVTGGPSASPSTAELLEAARSSGAAEVVLLPNDGNAVAVASAAATAARDEGLSAAVIPTRSVVQGLAALAVTDPDRALADDVGAMASAAGATRFGEVTTAVREAATMAGICQPGDVLGLVEGDVVVIGDDVEAVAGELLDRMLAGGGELVTVVTGEGAPDGAGERVAAHAEASHPEVEVVVYAGGQPHYPLLLGVE
jgi:uncharacterized protein